MVRYSLTFAVPAAEPLPREIQRQLRRALQKRGFEKIRMSRVCGTTLVQLECTASLLESRAIDDVFAQVFGEAPTRVDASLGEFVWDAGISCWVNENYKPKHRDPICLEIYAESPTANVERRFVRARDVLSDFKAHDRRLKEGITDELLPLYNDVWNEGRRIGRTRFVKQLKLHSLTLCSGGSWHAQYGIGDLFRDHVVQATLTNRGRVSATVAG